MSFIIISKELYSSGLVCPEGVIVDFSNFDECITILSTINNKPVWFYDLTANSDLSHEEIVPVRDQINGTGSNPLIGQQKKLEIDFVDMTFVYKCNGDGVVTHSCGNKLDVKFKYPSYFLAHIVILSRALGFDNIFGYLVNNNPPPKSIY